jgi:hypothetical protein
MLLSTLAGDEVCAPQLLENGIVDCLIDVLKAKQLDDEIVLQILFCFYQFLFLDSTRDFLMEKTQAVAYIIDLMRDKNSQVRSMCDSCFSIILEVDSQWSERIRMERFRWFNEEWIKMVEMSEVRKSVLTAKRGSRCCREQVAGLIDEDGAGAAGGSYSQQSSYDEMLDNSDMLNRKPELATETDESAEITYADYAAMASASGDKSRRIYV